MPESLLASLVDEDGSIADAMRALDVGAGGIALATDPAGRLVGVVTDGDLRRALLAGAGLDDPLTRYLIRDYVALRAGQGRAEALDLMRARHIDAIPVIDATGRPVALHLLHAFLDPVARPNWAIVMAGGEGRRLRPLTDTVPKPMLRVAGRPILERIVLHLVGFGFRRIFISVNYLGHLIEDHFGDGSDVGASIEYLRETEPLGTAGALSLLPEAPSDPVILLNGDLVTSVDLGRMLEFHGRGGYAATVGTRRYLHTVPFGCVDRDGDRVTSLDEKPTIAREINTGIYALEPWVVGLVERGVHAAMPDVLQQVLERDAPIGAFEVEDDWVDVGQRDQLVRAREGSDDA